MNIPRFDTSALNLNRFKKYPEAEPPKNQKYPAALPLRRTNNTCPPNAIASRGVQKNHKPAATPPPTRTLTRPPVRTVANRTVAPSQPRIVRASYNPAPQPQAVQNRMSSAQASSQLFNAAKSGNAQQVALLLQQGANPNQSNGNGETALHAAASVGNAGTIRQLVLAGANVNAATVQGWTPLHTAARFGHTGSVQTLLSMGANRYARNSSGKTPGQLARAANQNITANQLGG
ncbi:MAG: Unknown protein [uncultured Thiotrichaceae bacterium]|uniref:Uncharacterized protein n=1 Tax=uncultured Thiotrichaceae bacterium TaxID=298394 RepID=A0A6S6UFP3_9GAMM|nr:MAG: Unknown protein [uncultured Thiotrichaceae bacterium]